MPESTAHPTPGPATVGSVRRCVRVLHYLYADAGNYKEHGFVAVDCPDDEQAVQTMLTRLETSLFEGDFFVAEDVELEPLCPPAELQDVEVDHPMHQIGQLEPAGDGFDDARRFERAQVTLEQLADRFERAAAAGWPTRFQYP